MDDLDVVLNINIKSNKKVCKKAYWHKAYDILLHEVDPRCCSNLETQMNKSSACRVWLPFGVGRGSQSSSLKINTLVTNHH